MERHAHAIYKTVLGLQKDCAHLCCCCRPMLMHGFAWAFANTLLWTVLPSVCPAEALGPSQPQDRVSPLLFGAHSYR